VICSGKVYFDLYDEREARNVDDIYLLRVEQIYPFPLKAMGDLLSRFPSAEIVWCQEEPQNMGAWTFAEPRLYAVLEGLANGGKRAVRYAGRPASASTATGLMSKHMAQRDQFIEEALG
jgi:2-oxoglutarate dehydrogenase E1 component